MPDDCYISSSIFSLNLAFILSKSHTQPSVSTNEEIAITKRLFIDVLKRKRIKKKIYSTKDDARSDIFDYIEMLDNSKRRHNFNKCFYLQSMKSNIRNGREVVCSLVVSHTVENRFSTVWGS